MAHLHGISVPDFIRELDACFDRNDMKAARNCLLKWEEQARALQDDKGLLTVLNEGVGYYRRVKKRTRALEAMEESLQLVEKLGIGNTVSGATVFINAATTRSFFGQEQEAIGLYDQAEQCFLQAGKRDSYEYAALLNNRAATYSELKDLTHAERDFRAAVDVLKTVGHHAGEIAVSLVQLAHLTYERDDTATEQVEELLDEAWEYINSPDQERNGNYAYVLRKCAPSYDYFKRPEEAQALRDVANEIYYGED